MLGPLETALTATDTPPKLHDALVLAHRNAGRLQKLVNSLLDFSRIEAGRVRASYEPTDLAALTCDLASNFRSAMERAGLEFTVDCEALDEPLFVDREMWKTPASLETRSSSRARLAGD
jgi:signal transduction histidine kinase